MSTIQQCLEMPYNVAEMYELVNRIESYPEFLPWCTKSKVLHRDENGVQASLTLSGAGISKTFTTYNRLQKNKRIEIKLISGPFQHLEGLWLFEPTLQGSKIQLNLEFEFTNRLLDRAFRPIFERVALALIQAFSHRADQIYANRQLTY